MKSSKLFFLGKKKREYYNGILIRADTGLHVQVADAIRDISKGERMKIIDCGAGEGSLASRLSDEGHAVTAIDIDEESFRCTQAEFRKINFDNPNEFDDFVKSKENAYDIVVSTEVIEHVEDQWTYVRQLRRMAKPGGYLIITTPNTTSWLSRFVFLRTGQFSSFGDRYLTYGHISPISTWELNLMLIRCNLVNINIKPAGTLPPLYLVPTREILINLFMLPFRPFMRGTIDGWCIMAVSQKSLENTIERG